MDLAEFIEDLERRIDADDWTVEETKQLWKEVFGNARRNLMVRRERTNTVEKRKDIIHRARVVITAAVIEKLK